VVNEDHPSEKITLHIGEE